MAATQKREWLKKLRKEKGLSVREIAPLIGTSFSHYSDIENGRRNPSIDLSMKMAEFFSIEVSIFFKNRIKFNKEVS
jgi:transcriptional regulator with XRE-family HTH domain